MAHAYAWLCLLLQQQQLLAAAVPVKCSASDSDALPLLLDEVVAQHAAETAPTVAVAPTMAGGTGEA